MNIAIIGTGYVGLTTGTCLASVGHRVICVDNDEKKLEMLLEGKSPIYEPGLEELMAKSIAQGNLIFSGNTKQAIKESEMVFICVNTPPRHDGHADLKYVEKVAREIAEHLNGYKVIVDKSTVPVQTAEKVKNTIERYASEGHEFDVVSNPEFLREGTAVHDTLYPDRIVIGAESEKARNAMISLFEPLIAGKDVPVKITSVRSAELIKHGANTFLATKISFANLIAEACENAGADAYEVLDAIGLDARIGRHFLNHGIGFGGSCFPKDIKAFKKTLEVLGVDPSLVHSVESINQNAIDRFIQKIEKTLWVLDGKRIAILGLSFKPNTDDIRNSPALKIIDKLLSDGVVVSAHDPKAMDKTRELFPDIMYANSPYEAVKGCDAVVFCTEWQEYKDINLRELGEKMQTRILFDGRGVIDPKNANDNGFQYYGMGR